jgi:hypothetical protein
MYKAGDKMRNAMMNKYILLLLSSFLLTSCAGPQPIIYSTNQSQQASNELIQQDITECKALAENAGADGSSKGADVAAGTAKAGAVGAASGAVGGAIAGSVGQGAAIGAAGAATAGLIHGLFSSSQPSQAYMNFVTRCLTDRGYEISGWD